MSRVPSEFDQGDRSQLELLRTYLSDADIRTLATGYAPGAEQPTAEPAPVGAIETGWAPA